MLYKKLFLLPLLFLGLFSFATAQTTTAKKASCSEKKACCAKKADGSKAACCTDKSKAACDAKAERIGFVKKTASTAAVASATQTKGAFKANGVCGMCKMRIERAATAVAGVSAASWDVMTLELSVSYDAETVSLNDIETAVAAVGHDTDNVRASDAVYAELHGCCKYERSK